VAVDAQLLYSVIKCWFAGEDFVGVVGFVFGESVYLLSAFCMVVGELGEEVC
jgi:hypothetical protein